MTDSIFIIFGITGDLSKRYLLSSLYRLIELDLLPHHFYIVGVSRKDVSRHDVIAELEESMQRLGLQYNHETMQRMQSMLRMVQMDSSNPDDYKSLQTAVHDIEQQVGKPLNRLYYLAVPPETFVPIVSGLEKYELHSHDTVDCKLLIEKPFGSDTASAEDLISQLQKTFSEESIYRVDHYLAKETAQNILTFRFKNPMFRAIWDHASISHIILTASEAIGIENRVNFYENIGALRDFTQSHLLQLLALVTMEDPGEFRAKNIHAAKLALLQSVVPITAENVSSHAVRGQYNTYRQEAGNPDSYVETYAAIKLTIDNDRWRGVPILLRTGKALAKRATEMKLVFKQNDTHYKSNVPTIRIQPNEGISLCFNAKRPSLGNEHETVNMDFQYSKSFDGDEPNAYERVLADAIRGDKTLFTSSDEVIVSWQILEAVVQAWSRDDSQLHTYESGSWGPTAADQLASDAGVSWHGL